jgi:hypothetical protein
VHEAWLNSRCGCIYTQSHIYSYERAEITLRSIGVGLVLLAAASVSQAIYTINID